MFLSETARTIRRDSAAGSNAGQRVTLRSGSNQPNQSIPLTATARTIRRDSAAGSNAGQRATLRSGSNQPNQGIPLTAGASDGAQTQP